MRKLWKLIKSLRAITWLNIAVLFMISTISITLGVVIAYPELKNIVIEYASIIAIVISLIVFLYILVLAVYSVFKDTLKDIKEKWRMIK